MLFTYRILGLLVCLFSAGSAGAADTTRVLFIGNSFTFYNDLPGTVAALAASSGDVVIHASHTPGGAAFINHSSSPTALALIDSGVWDYVVLQEQSQRPAFPDAQVEVDFYPWAKILADRVKLANPCTRVVFYNTWGYRLGDPMNCPMYAPLCSYTGMDSVLRLRYDNAADSNGTYIAPAGPVWRRLRTAMPSLNLYDADDRHPSPAGSYAAACAVYAVILGKSPTAATYDATLPATDAALIRGAATAVAFDSLSHWQRHYVASPLAASFILFQSGVTVTYANSSVGGASYSWSFGDGTTDTSGSPVHSYASAGTYTVRLIAQSACGAADTFVQTVVVSTAGVEEATGLQRARIGPNPAHDVLLLRDLPAHTSVVLTDAAGRVVGSWPHINGMEFSVSVAALPRGLYMLRAAGPREARSWKVLLD